MRLAKISFHTSPLAPLGRGKAGGMNAYILGLGRELGRRGIQVDCFTRRTSPDGPAIQEAGSGMRVISLPAGPLAPLPPASLLAYREEFQIGLDAFRNREGLGYDLLHAHYYLSGWVGLQLKPAWQIPLFFMFHTIGPLKEAACGKEGEREPAWRKSMEEEVAQGADLIIASSPHEGDSIQSLYGVSKERIAVVPCGVDTRLFRPLDREEARRRLSLPSAKLLLFVGRLEPIKGMDLLLEAMARLRSLPDLPAHLLPKLLVVGSEGGSARWRRRAEELRVGPLLLFLGAQPHARMPLFYGACDAVVIPSRYESFGIVALEAAACGRPVIATSVGGLPYAVSPDRTALLVPSEDAQALARAIQRILTHQDLADGLGREGRRWAQSFSWPRIAESIRSHYQEALHPPALRESRTHAEAGP
ncbi:MAG: glycosyltransferase [candidate division NC10 bacterium]|nr:glycosyltransferase [candidate division NC10 bacterium]